MTPKIKVRKGNKDEPSIVIERIIRDWQGLFDDFIIKSYSMAEVLLSVEYDLKARFTDKQLEWLLDKVF